MFGLRKSTIFLLALLFCGISVVAGKDCDVSVAQTSSSTWFHSGTAYTLVQVALTNNGTSNINGLTLNIDADFDGMWEMQSNGNNLYSLPSWRSHVVLAPGQVHSWGYIVKSASAATLSVESVVCGDAIPVPATEAPATQAPTPDPCADSEEEQPATQAPTTPATQAPTTPATEAPATQAPTRRPTEPATQAPTRRPTEPATQAPTRRPTEPATQAPTRPATQAPTRTPTQPATQAPTRPATQAPTRPATQAPTRTPTSPPSTGAGRLCPAGQIWSPAPGTTWQWQITDKVDTSIDVQMYDIDLFSAEASVISTLHRAGRAVVCYFSTQYEDWRPDAASFRSADLGNDLDDWEGEKFVDIRSANVRNIMKARLDLAVSKGCDGVEPDNVDGYSNSNGLGLTAADQLDYNKFLANEAHKRGLSIALKNDLSQVSQLVSYFDFAVNEQCNEYDECDDLTPFVTAGKAVFGVEYEGSMSSYCPAMKTMKFSWLQKELHLGSKVDLCCATTGGCSPVPYSCKSIATSKRSIDADETVEIIETETIEAENVIVAEPENIENSASFAIPSLAAALVAVVALAL